MAEIPDADERSTLKSSRRLQRNWMYVLALFVLCVIVSAVVVTAVELTKKDPQNDNKPMPDIQRRYQEKADKIMQYILKGEHKGQAYDWVANISDTFGHRKIGSKALEDAIDYNVRKMQEEYGLDNVHTEEVSLPHWVYNVVAHLDHSDLGQLSTLSLSYGVARLRAHHPMHVVTGKHLLGLGSTVGTNGDLTADAMVVTSWDELNSTCKLLAGKIVVYCPPWVNYGMNAKFRTSGASRAGECGAVAALIRSAASSSIYSPHTGQQYYSANPIPAASLTVEDAELLLRMQRRDQKITITLNMASHNDPAPIISRNTIFELTGAVHAQQAVMVSGHFDSWDVGGGAMDNGGGAAIALQAIVALKKLMDQGVLPRPKRTIRGIHWTAEEPGSLGAQNYYNAHRNNDTSSNETSYIFLQEADEGFFRPIALDFAGSDSARNMFVDQIMPLVRSLNITKVVPGGLGDSQFWADDGVPGIMMGSDEEGYERYFSFHHTEADMPTVYNRADLDAPTAMWAVLAYVIADMDETIPMNKMT